jgi:hypothetical protein
MISIPYICVMINIHCIFDKCPYNIGTVYIGKYQISNTYIAAAVIHSPISVDTLRSVYNAEQKQFFLYPNGTIQCACCLQRNIPISSQAPAHVIHYKSRGDIDYHYSKMRYQGLVCHDCAQQHGDNTIQKIQMRIVCGSIMYWRNQAIRDTPNFVIRCLVNRWRNLTKRRKAIRTLEPYILHWASKPNGPLYRLAHNRIKKEQELQLRVHTHLDAGL